MNVWKAFLFTLIFISSDALLYLIFVSPFEFNWILNFKYYSTFQLLSKFVFYIFIWIFLFKNSKTNLKNFQIFNLDFVFYLLIIVFGLRCFNLLFFNLYNFLFNNTEILNYKGLYKFKFDIDIVCYYVGSLIIAPIGEELFFRGFIFKRLRRSNELYKSIIISSICFSLIHLPNYSNIIPTLILGILCAYILFRTKNIIYPIIFHFLYNLLSILFQIRRTILPKYFSEDLFGTKYLIFYLIGIILIYKGITLLNRETNIDEKTHEKNDKPDSVFKIN